MPQIKSLSPHLRRRSRGRSSDGQPNKIDLHIGSRIRQRRQLLHWSQEKLGVLLGLTFQQIQKYEKGINRVSGSRLYDFAAVLGVSVDYFYQDMSVEVQNQSPRHVIIGETAADGNGICTDDPMKSEAAVRLVKSFLRIPNRQLAEKMFEVMEILSKSNWRLQKEEADTD